ncbi:MAG: phosphopantothenate/pantothenate synthetase [Desulfurococcales archaeon]|nr:phosphopantothenate/pantothenate synthetase [Desulfurococcales archaeon]
MTEIPRSHPRYESLLIREKIIEGYKRGMVALAGLIAHGRGEAFDYIIGEKTREFAIRAIEAGAALMLLGRRTVISVNGNTAVLVPESLVEYSRLTGIPLEVNLFYRTREREEAIYDWLKDHGAPEVLGVYDTKTKLEGLESWRRVVSVKGIYSADVVLVPLEDGDRTEALKKLGKKVVTIDLNPFSRTSQFADITIVDNICRAFPLLINYTKKLMNEPKQYLEEIVSKYNNRKILSEAVAFIRNRLSTLSDSLHPLE